MAETFAELVEEWQTGALLLVAAVIGGTLGTVAASSAGPTAGIVGFFTGGALVFAVISYLLYGR